MYANLKVTTSSGKVLSAWKVKVESDGATGIQTRVFLDVQDGTGKYPESAGVLVLKGTATIEADF